tara:strand:- start:1212 stop:5102 length:3891 start_codon:yes stop_codon:yes gene_type:complete
MKTLLLLTLILATARLMAATGEVWHIPAGTESAISTTMRSPLYEVKDSDIVIYQGFWKDSGNNGNQDGGNLHYRLTPTGGSAGLWQTVALGFDSNSGTNQFWKATLPSAAVDATDVIEYYIEVTFDDLTGNTPDDTFLYGGDLDGNNQKIVTEATAQAAPYSIRNRPGWIYHANDSTVSGNTISIALKTGYIGPDNDAATRWANAGVIYYTIDGSTPAGAFGTGTGNTFTTALSYDGVVGDNSGNGNAAVWRGTLVDVLDGLPLGSEVKYKISLWNTATNEEKFADHVAGIENDTYTYQNGTVGEPSLTIDGLNANYTTSKHFIDEIAGDSVNLTIVFESGEANTTEAEIYTNLNRRDRADEDANGDGYDDGISGLDGNSLVAGDDTYYYKAYTMTSAGSGVYNLTLPANKTGVYRLTARWRVTGDPTWRWYTNTTANRRDHAITISPVDARHINLYEMNVFNVEASGSTFGERSTLEDLHNATGAAHNGSNRWDLDYLTDLGCNWLWFQPIHPNGIDGRENDPGTGSPYQPGSPYAVKNFFEVNELMSINYNGASSTADNRAASMTAFQNFVTAADTKSVGIMLDSPFNHTSFDVELAQAGVDLFQPDGSSWSITDQIRNRDARFFSLDGNYGNRASSGANIAAGPDRFDFGKWNDVKDVFFGRYDALVEVDFEPERSSYTNEGDWFDVTDTDWTANDFLQGGQNRNTTRQVWKYFATYATHWLDKTRPTGQNRNSSTEGGLTTEQRYAWDAAGIDGLRCDFGQGLPSRAWEYMINVAREQKWNFVMMSESLDGGAVTYRSNRNFDILNENIVFPLKSATNKYSYRDIFNDRRNAYGQALVLMNTASHDEENYDDPWEAVVRIAVTATNEGVAMVFPGQELGITRTTGYTNYETNFGKQIAHFKKWNSMKPAWDDGNFGNDQLYPVLSGMLSARNNSPSLTSSNRWFLDGDGGNDQIHAVAKYETANASPVTSDVVIAFTNLDRNNDKSDNFKIPAGLAPLLGLQDARTYNVKNIAAYLNDSIGMTGRRDDLLWGSGISGADLKSGGFLVSLNKIPTQNTGTDPENPNEPAWDEKPYEGQYLKVYDVTAPASTPAKPVMPNNHDYEIGTQANFDWADVTADSEGIVPHYEVTVIINSGNPTTYITTQSEYTVSASEGNQVSVSVRAVNPNDNSSKGPTSSQSQSIKLLSSDGDEDSDGISNADEKEAGTNPRDNSSKLKVVDSVVNGSDQFTLSWPSVLGITYGVQSKEELTAVSWFHEPTGTGIAGTGSIIAWSDPNPINPVTLMHKFYRVIVE